MAQRPALGVLVAFLVGCATVASAQPPESILLEATRAKDRRDQAWKDADKKLLTAFDTEIESVRKSRTLTPEARQQTIAAIQAERASFEAHGTVPFSPSMRTAARIYLAALQKANAPVATAYDKLVEYYQSPKVKDDQGAKDAILKKKEATRPKLAGIWECTGINFQGTFTRTLYTDGTAGEGRTWSLEKDRMVLIERSPGSPPGGWVEQNTVDSAGQAYRSRNQTGGEHNARRIDPPKNP